MPKVKSKSTTPGRTKKRRTGRTTSRKPAKRSGTKKHPVSLGARKYYVPQKVFLKLLEDLEPHRSKEEELLSFEKFFEADQADIPKWATYPVSYTHLRAH